MLFIYYLNIFYNEQIIILKVIFYFLFNIN